MIMPFDMVTLFIVTAVVAIISALAMLYVSRFFHHERSVLFWAQGFVVNALASLIFGLREQLPLLLTILLGNTLAIAGSALLYLGTCAFLQKTPRWGVILPTYILALAVIAYWSLVGDNISIRNAAYSAAVSVSFLLIALDLIKEAHDQQRLVYGTVAVVCLMYIGTLITRAVVFFTTDDEVTLLSSISAQIAWMLASQFVVFLSSFGFLLMVGLRLQQRLDRLASYDELTGALNRRAFDAHSEEILNNVPSGSNVAFLVFDLDDFKRINDLNGHDAGDRVLQVFAEVCSQQMPEGALLARAGGDEFWLLATHLGREQAIDLAERIRRSVANSVIGHGEDRLRQTVTAGVSTFSFRAADISELLDRVSAAADEALYKAKSQGRNAVAYAELALP